MSKEETLQYIYVAMQNGKIDHAISDLDNYTQPYIDRIAQLESELQTAVDEVNRLNVIIEKQGKVINALRDE